MLAVGVTAALLCVAAASAEEGRRFHRVRLVWQVDERASRCAREEIFRLEVARRLGASPFDPDAGAALTVSINASGATLEGRVQTPGAAGSALRAPLSSCAELVALLAGRTAVYLEDDTPPTAADASDVPAEVTTDDASEVDAAAELAVDHPVPPSRGLVGPVAAGPLSATENRPWRLEAALSPTLTLQGQPTTVALGVSGALRLRVRAFSIGLDLSAVLPVEEVQGAEAVSLRAMSVRGLATACVHPWRLGFCALGGAVVNLVSIADGRANREEGVVFTHGALGGRLDADLWQTRRIGLGAHLDGLALPAAGLVRLPGGEDWRVGWVVSVAFDVRFTIL